MSFHVPERYRFTSQGHPWNSTTRNGNNGVFVVPLTRGQTVNVIASDGLGWEHVSVSRKDRCPTWDEMCQVKALFWDQEDCVIQFHPPRSEYVNNHPYCLHLWRPIGIVLPMPDSLMVGIKGIAA